MARSKFKGDDLVVAWTSFATGDDLISRGTRLRADHRIVKAFPAYFVDENTPDEDWPNELSLLADPPVHRPEFHKVQSPPPADKAVICHTTFTALATGRRIDKGAILHRDDAMVRDYPDFFNIPAVPLSVKG